MFPLPKHFDENEWTIIVGIFLSTLLWRLPKKIPTEITILIVLFSMAVPKIMDHLIASVSPNLYQITDSEKYELFDLLLDIVYIPFGYLCIYVYEIWKPKKLKLVFYIFLWSVLAVCFEFVMVKVHVFTYRGWRLAYSFPIYITVITIALSLYVFLTNYNQRRSTG